MSRVATSQIFDRSQKHIATAREREAISSDKASSGKEITRPSQNPTGYAVASALKDEMAVGSIVQKNVQSASRILNLTETVFSQVQEITQRGHELAIATAGNNALSIASREPTKHELENLYHSMLQALNTRYGPRTLLAGHNSTGPAFDAAGNFLGDNGEIRIDIGSGLKVPINVSADRAIFGKGLQDGVDILKPFRDLIQGLGEGNIELIRSTIDQFEMANNQISLVRGELGARMLQIDRADNNLEQFKIESTGSVAEIEEADAIKVFSDLARDHTVLQAAVSTSQRLLNDSPTDKFYR